jgi:hypothetical protein
LKNTVETVAPLYYFPFISSRAAPNLVGQTIAFCRLPFSAQSVVTRGPPVEWAFSLAFSLPCRHFWRHFFFICGLPLCGAGWQPNAT